MIKQAPGSEGLEKYSQGKPTLETKRHSVKILVVSYLTIEKLFLMAGNH